MFTTGQMTRQSADYMMMLGKWLIPVFLGLLAVIFLSGIAKAQTAPPGCGALENDYGPLDYRTEQDKLKVVEKHHFSPNIEALISGNSASVGGELDYTLKTSPNHHRALVALMNFSEKTHSSKPYGMSYAVECYFERALRFRPDDSTARMIYATFLVMNKRGADATTQLEAATVNAGDNSFTHYNIGRIYFDMKNYDRALIQAHKAYALGFGRPMLRDQLISVGAWKAPDASLDKQP